MSKHFAGSASFLVLLILLAAPTKVHADTLIIRGGAYTDNSPNQNLSGVRFNFTGQNFSLGNLSDGDAGQVAARNCTVCSAGTAVSLASGNASADLRFGPADIGGTHYDKLYYSASSFEFSAPTVVIPSSNSPTLTITAPFTFTGLLRGCTVNPNINGCSPSELVLNTTLSGEGTAVLELVLSGQGPGLYRFNSITYNFNQPVPEPTTLLLLGTGLAGVAARFRRRRA